MALSSYSDLKSSIQSWMLDRSDLAASAADFIALAEADLNEVLRARSQLTVTQLTPDANGQITLPSDYLEYRQVTAITSPRRPLQMIAPSDRDAVYPFRESSLPVAFTIDGGTMLILPVTSSNIELEYYAKIPALSDSNTTNWLLTARPNLYLYGSLKHAAVFIRDTEAAQMFGGLFNGILDAAVKAERGSIWSRGAARVAGPNP